MKVLKFLTIITLILFSNKIISQKKIHVFAKEIPWKNGTVSQKSDKIYSINTAITLASSGDEIIIHEGVYRETITVNKNNLTFTNFENEYVLVSGTEIVTGFTDASGMTNVKVADVSGLTFQTTFSQLFANGKEQFMARHPNNTIGNRMRPLEANSGYALLSNISKDSGASGSGYATFNDVANFPSTDLTGGIFRGFTGKMRNYAFGIVTSATSNSVTFTGTSNNQWSADAAISNTNHKFAWGYVLHKNLIDIPGEWFIDSNNLYFMPESGKTMDDYLIEVQVREQVINANNVDGLTIDGLHFTAGNAQFQNTSNITIKNSSFRYLYPFWTPTGYGDGVTFDKGIHFQNESNITFENNYVANTWASALTFRDGNNVTVKNNIIENIGYLGIFTASIYCTSDNTLIQQNTFGDQGRFHIRMRADAKIDILDNDFYGAMQTGEDAGPIEATSTGKIGALDMKGSTIAYNKVHDFKGIPVSDGNYNKQKATAFYMEDTENYTAHHNLIYNVKADNYTGPHSITKEGDFLYLGPRYNAMFKPVNYYNNTIWNVDKNIGVWSIEINNWVDLGVAEAYNKGKMTDGDFANNIFMTGPNFSLSYVSQVLTATGGFVSWVTLNPSPSFSTTDFSTYTTTMANYDYNFNPQNNLQFVEQDAATHFADAANGDFTLQSGSSAKNAGVSISGITSSANPDVGALEGSNRVLNAGSTLTIPTFTEKIDRSAITASITNQENTTSIIDMGVDEGDTKEDVGLGVIGPGSANPPTISKVINPNPEGINTTYNCIQFIETSGSATWNGAQLSFGPNGTYARNDFNLNTNRFFKFQILSPTSKTITLRVDVETGNTTNYTSSQQVTLTANTWAEVLFDLTGNDINATIDNPSANNNRIRIYVNHGTSGDGSTYYFDEFSIEPNKYETVANGDYNSDANWYPAHAPKASMSDIDIKHNISYIGNLSIKDFTIEENKTVDITGDLTLSEEAEMQSGSQLKVSGAASGNIKYNRNIATTNWYLVAAPFDGETIDDLIANNTFATGSNTNIGIATYDNTQVSSANSWSYMSSSSTGNIISGKGYAIKLNTIGDFDVTGTINTTDITTPISVGAGNAFNLLGNPYSCSIAINNNADATNNLLKINDTDNDYLTESTVWMWNQATGNYTAVNQATNATYLAPSQAFFVSANGSHNFSFTEGMQSIQTDNFQKSASTRPEINLNLSDGVTQKTAQIFYIEESTKGFDNGYDSTIFGGADNSLAIYTAVLENSNGKKLQIQSLPNSDFENMVIPIGVNAQSGKEITISAEALNLPQGLKIFLEDRNDNSFTELTSSSNFTYKVTSSLNGIGRFYLHTKSSILHTNHFNFDEISIFALDKSTIRVVGLSKEIATIKLLNILGKQMMQKSITSNGISDIKLPSLSSGVYIVQLITKRGKINKKLYLNRY